MSTTDRQIAEILERYDEPFATSVWRVQGNAVIQHKALERIAVKARIEFEVPVILRAERDEAVMLVVGHSFDEHGAKTGSAWSIGEALIGGNYKVSGKQAAYPYAMSEKRAKDRVILKLIGLHGLLYSEDESDDFRQGRTAPANAQAAEPAQENGPPDDVRKPDAAERREYVAAIRARIRNASDAEKLAEWWTGDDRKAAFREWGVTDEEAADLRNEVIARRSELAKAEAA